MNSEERAALLIAGSFRAPELGEVMEKQGMLWRWVRTGQSLRSVSADHWAAAGFQFYMWDHVVNEREARGCELMVLSAIYPLGVRFVPGEGVIIMRPETGTPIVMPNHVQANARVQTDIDYLRQIVGLQPLSAAEFIERYDQAVPVESFALPTAADLDRADRALSAAEHEVDS